MGCRAFKVLYEVAEGGDVVDTWTCSAGEELAGGFLNVVGSAVGTSGECEEPSVKFDTKITVW